MLEVAQLAAGRRGAGREGGGGAAWLPYYYREGVFLMKQDPYFGTPCSRVKGMAFPLLISGLVCH
jgi:hypothetical protein